MAPQAGAGKLLPKGSLSMSDEVATESRIKPWLLFRSGSLAGTRYPIPEGTTRVGRAPDNDVVVHGAESTTVSLYHLEVTRSAGSWRVRDLGSTNGTWLDGDRITDAEITPPVVLRLGSQGPEFGLVLEDAVPVDLDRTVEVSAAIPNSLPAAQTHPVTDHERLLSSAVVRARRMRVHGAGGQTLTIMREVVEKALHQSRRRFRLIGYSLLAALLAVTTVAFRKITDLKQEKRVIDHHIQQLETQLEKTNRGTETDQILSQLGDYQNQAESVQRTLLYRLGTVYEKGDFVTGMLRSLMAEFGAEVYSIPPDFVERVNYYIHQYQGPDRPLIVRALNEENGRLMTMRRILQEQQLPPDLAFIPLVESAFASNQSSTAGPVGLWQLTASTAKAYGLRVDGQVDERQDLVKSTRATCKYLRDLILDFGNGSSVMLALAAYDSGTSKVKQAVDRTVKDPIKQRNFWYLYRTRALPEETREYVPKVFAAIVIGRDPGHFGF